MPYIVTYRLNREQGSYWYLESLDLLPKQIAEYLSVYDEEFDFDFDSLPVIGIYEVLKEIKLREPPKNEYDHGDPTHQMADIISRAREELNNIHAEDKREREERQKKQEEAEFKRLKAKLGK